jgi:TrmH family RNA methyltransferase
LADPLGAKNPRVQWVRRLATSRRSRVDAGAFIVEGPTLVAEALAADVEVREVFCEPGAEVDGVPTTPVEAGVLRRIGDAVTSQGVLAVVSIPAPKPIDDRPVLVLVGLADPGNAGTLVRVAEAADFGAVRFCAGSVDPWSPKSVRASAGSMLRVPVMVGGEAVAVLAETQAAGRRCIGTRMADAPSYADADLGGPVAIVLGNEAHGLPADLDDVLDGWVRIPMAGQVESLNVAMAGTLLCFEVARRR